MMIPTKNKDAIWSDEQWKAIYLRGNNILVSAGAGSGKTAVLSERVLQYVLRGNSVSRLIILTFTNASAREMKDRIRKCLLSNKDKINPIELELLEGAHIETFDAFSLSLVKKYHYLLGVTKNISITDKSLLKFHKKRILDELINELYQDSKFIKILDFLTTKDDSNIKELLLKINRNIELISDKEAYFNNFSSYYDEDHIKKQIKEYQNIAFVKIELAKEMFIDLINEYDSTMVYDHLTECYNRFNDLFESKTIIDIINSIDVKWPSLPKKILDEEEKEKLKKKKDKIKDVIKSIKQIVLKTDIELLDEILQTKEDCLVLATILEEYNKRLDKFKLENNMFDFMDIALLAIKLFKENENLRKEFVDSIDEILVDEYQDTSDVQEELINLISNNNVYMVGDIKQSIYRFRNANPNIFKYKYDTYQNINDIKEDITIYPGIRIDLAKNFRSRKEVLDNINLIFEKIMDKNLGGASYNDGHRLSFGNKAYNTSIPHNYDMEFYEYDTNYDSTYCEAYIIGKDIINKLNNNYTCFDKGSKKAYKASYKDFTILTQKKSEYEIYKRVFEYLGIPLLVHKEDEFFKSDEIYVLSNIFKLIYSFIDKNYYDDYFKASIVSLLRSYIVNANDDDILDAISNNQLEEKFEEVFNKLYSLVNIAKEDTINNLLLAIYDKFEFYSNSIKIGNINQIENKLNYLYLLITDFAKMGYQIKDLVEYFDILIENDFDIEFSNIVSNVDAVNIMTIHKSKGLEFPICYFPSLAKNFNKEDLKGDILYDKNIGLAYPINVFGPVKTFYYDLIKYHFDIDDIGEKIRLLYVALTRAKEKMIFVMKKQEKYEGNDCIVSLSKRLKYKSFLDMIKSIINEDKKIVDLFDKNNFIENISNANLEQFLNDMELLDTKEVVLLDTIDSNFETIDSELKKEEIISRQSSIKNLSVLSKEEQEKMNYGTYVHQIFEYIDFMNPDFSLIDHKIRNKIKAFFEHDCIKNLKIINVYKELSYEYENNNGIIDLILETNDSLYIIDYKLKDISKEGYRDQLNSYKRYLESISDKKVYTSLYSVIDNIFEVIE